MDLKQQAKLLQPVIRIGKNGLNENVFNEVEKLLKKRKLIKIKILNNCSLSKEEVTGVILEKSRAQLVQSIGNTIVIFRHS